MEKIIFVTGTDTGVGKTLVTALLLQHLRQSGVNALAMKPFCSGGRGDVEMIQALQKGALTDEEANPFYFREPVAPLVAARKHRRRISLREVIASIRRVERKCERLVVEGAGGLLVPLGEGFTVADVIAKLCCDVLVVARNQLGTINHTLLTVEVLRQYGQHSVKILLSAEMERDDSALTNKKILAELLAPTPVWSLCSLSENAMQSGAVKTNAKKMKKVLALICG